VLPPPTPPNSTQSKPNTKAFCSVFQVKTPWHFSLFDNMLLTEVKTVETRTPTMHLSPFLWLHMHRDIFSALFSGPTNNYIEKKKETKI